MQIHWLFILNKGGVCLYSKSFTKEYKGIDVNLITPFFSAIFQFSQNVVSKDLEELEMGGLRFTFRIENEFIFVLLSDVSVSILFTSTRLLAISDAFFRIYYRMDKLRDVKEIENPEFDKTIESIITGAEEIFESRDFYKKVINLFKDMIFSNDITGAALLSTQGNIIYSSLPSEILLSSVKELEIRFMSGVMSLPEAFYSLESGEKVFSSIVSEDIAAGLNFFIVLLFDSSVPLGMAEMNLMKTTKAIKKLVLSE